MLSRRSFLVSAGAGLAAGSLVNRMAFANHHEKIPLGIQLWTVKDEAAKDLDIELLDHVIVGQPATDPRHQGYYSFREAGVI